MISSWYVPNGFCFPFGSKYSVKVDSTKRKERAIIQKYCLKVAIKIMILIILGYSYKNLEKDMKWQNEKKVQK